jgi:uncharacterized protein with HEPN domain
VNIGDRERVEDIHEFAQTLAILVARGKDNFSQEIVFKLSVERLIISIGEACNKMSSEFQAANPQIPWRDIVGMRNLLIHAYERIDSDQVWAAASKDIPDLVKSLAAL